MSTAAYRNAATPSFTVPPSQNTALVLEFNCLYTHDVRRKQKRWQDGFLRFHTFNKRVMVFDVPRNFIGDTHWKSEEALQDGDEVTLETEGVIVQVTESVGRTETDISELRKSRKKRVSNKDSDSSSPVKAPRTPAISSHGHEISAQPRHRSLKTMLDPPNGPIGKARLPTQSPFERRLAEKEKDDWRDPRPSKKPRVQKSPYHNTARANGPTNQAHRSEVHRNATGKTRTSKPPMPEDVVDLYSDVSEQTPAVPMSSGIIVPPLSPLTTRRPAPGPVAVLSSSPAFQRQSTPHNAANRNSHVQTRLAPESSVQEPRSDVFASVDADGRRHDQTNNASNERNRKPKATPRKALRMAAGEPRKKTLLCQDQWNHAASTAESVSMAKPLRPPIAQSEKDVERTAARKSSQQRQLQERLAKIAEKDSTHAPGPQQCPRDPHRGDAVLKPRSPNHLRRSFSESNQLPTSGTSFPVRPIDAEALATAENPPSDATRSVEQETVRDLPKAVWPKPRTNRNLARAVSLNLAANGTSTVMLKRPFKPPPAPQIKTPAPDRTPDPWSREAFDLFTWRPPGWDEEKWCLPLIRSDTIKA